MSDQHPATPPLPNEVREALVARAAKGIYDQVVAWVHEGNSNWGGPPRMSECMDLARAGLATAGLLASADDLIAARTLRDAASQARAALGDAVSGHTTVAAVRHWLKLLVHGIEAGEWELSEHEAAIAARTLQDAWLHAASALSNGGYTSTYSVRRWLNELADQKAPLTPVDAPRVRPQVRRTFPKCVTCGHSERSHNELSYCTTGAGTPRQCGCDLYDDGLRRQPDGTFAPMEMPRG